MQELAFAERTLSQMLNHLGIDAQVRPGDTEVSLEIDTPNPSLLIGKNGDRLDDIQYLVNRIIIEHFPDCPKIRVDCDHYRQNEEEKLEAEVREAAAQVRASGKPARLRPMNAYYRKLAYDALSSETGVHASSPSKPQRYKRIEITPLEGNSNS